MSACKTLVRTSLSSITSTLRTNRPTVSLLHSPFLRFSPLPPNQGTLYLSLSLSLSLSLARSTLKRTFLTQFCDLNLKLALRLAPYNVPSRPYASISSEAAAADFTDEAHSADSTLEPPENPTQETVEELLRKKNEVAKGGLQATANTTPVLGIGGFTSSIKIN